MPTGLFDYMIPGLKKAKKNDNKTSQKLPQHLRIRSEDVPEDEIDEKNDVQAKNMNFENRQMATNQGKASPFNT